MDFKTVTIVKHPVAVVWETMQQHLAAIASNVPDIDTVTPVNCQRNEEGQLLMVNTWKAKPPLPDFLAKFVLILNIEVGAIDDAHLIPEAAFDT